MLKKFFIAALVLFLLTGAVHAEQKSSRWQPIIRVGVLSGVKQISLQVSAPCIIINAAKGSILKKIPADKRFILTPKYMDVNAIEILPEKIPLKDFCVTVGEKKYFGGLSVVKTNGALNVVSLAPLEEYLRGVLAKEMSPSYPVEALKAQAVAARSFALKNRGRHDKDGFDLCNETHCQVYDGAVSYESIDRAINETRGEVLVYKEKLIDTNFHADSGGMTENSQDVWGGSTPYLVAVREIIQIGTPWTVKVAAKDFSSRFGENFGEVKSIGLSKMTVGQGADDRTSSGRVKSAQIVGSQKTVTLSGNDLRRKFSLPSTLFDMTINGDEIIFTGFGRGHGVGMSQVGARDYAGNGWSYEKILSHYYKDTRLKKLY